MNDEPDDIDDGDDPMHWGGAELGAPKPNPRAPARRQRTDPDDAERIELAAKAKAHLATMTARPPWPGAPKVTR